ncbi:alpha/beta hydrolase-fold protein [Altericroceibacterium xinjiangense]|uniref:alpha/beta hydrolase-fold protein n=1 Tax=Altericroceibacterium xinjiangense TaxID=762261 RepID=UPI000F7F5E38|nr:alpha/beta hydrolase-fold protein [Altericroceibacterium xinjiangense]
MFATYDFTSVEVLPDQRVTFRLCAPEANDVRVVSTDIADVIPMGFPPGTPVGLPMTKNSAGLWSVTTAKPVPADTYRFNFQVDGARVPDPLATEFSAERTGINSLFEVKGPEGAFQTFQKDVPHGAISEVEYWSDSIGAKRRAHVYTPPGYMKGDGSYPVLYLVHGAGDSDDSWSTVGRANYILDNLIAAGQAKPMIVIMPFGHTPPRAGQDMLNNNDFGNDLIRDLMPYVDANFRTLTQPENRAMAGLSMGGAHTIRNGLTHPELFDHIGIFSMGLGVGGNGDQVAQYTAENDVALRRAAQDLDLVYYAMGKDDFLYGTVAPTRAMLNRYGIKHVYNESSGGHTWINWRRYLADFAPRLFH